MDGLGATSSSGKAHPLASPGRVSAWGSSRSSLTDTRPRLRHMLSDMDVGHNGSAHSSEDAMPPRTPPRVDRETMVIVHEVSEVHKILFRLTFS